MINVKFLKRNWHNKDITVFWNWSNDIDFYDTKTCRVVGSIHHDGEYVFEKIDHCPLGQADIQLIEQEVDRANRYDYYKRMWGNE